MEKHITFKSNPFAEGRFRYAYKGTLTVHPTKRVGHEIVVKKNKKSFIWDRTGWKKTIDMYKISERKAKLFNQKHPNRALPGVPSVICKHPQLQVSCIERVGHCRRLSSWQVHQVDQQLRQHQPSE